MNGVDKTLWSRLSPLLDELLDLPEPERDARIAALRATDPEAAEAVADMLGLLPGIEQAGFLSGSAMPKPAGLAGQTVGAYTLERELGHGGMGTVWLARRTDGRYQGEVAIKFLRAGLFGHGDAARFEREGSILARLSHPHIARLLDAGVTSDGTQPYLVLEYIDGEPIDAYCRRLALPVAARLRLMLDVLAAVAHAHNRLILHRDLKPSNILVTAAGEVKLLDFGIAKLMADASAGGEATALTAHAGNAFTPEFAAPEQMGGTDVTTATDVYSLGVLMYVLLGGEHPTPSITGTPLDRMRAVMESEPRKLSEAMLRRGDAASRKLAAELRGDVDTIVARALKKAPAERYANAADLADDVRRYLAHEPIAARPDARLYRVAKFVRRHRTGVAAASIAALALAAGVGVALWQAREASRQRVQAEGLIEFMLGDLRHKLEPVGRLDVLDGVGARALQYYASQDLSSLDADSLGQRARALHMIGDLAEQRGKLDEAQRDFQEAAQSTAELLQRHPRDPQRIFDQSQSEYYVGLIQWRRGRLQDALASFTRYREQADRMTALVPTNADWQLERAYAGQNMAVVLDDLGRAEEALTMNHETLAAMGRLQGPRGEDGALDTATALGWTAHTLELLGRYGEAISAQQRKIAIARALPDAAQNTDALFLAADGECEIGRSEQLLGHPEAARAALKSAIAHLEALTAHDPGNLDWVSELETAHGLLATEMLHAGDLAGSRAEAASTSALLARLMATKSPKRNWRINQVGRQRVLLGRLAQDAPARAAARRGLDDYLADVRRYEAGGGQPTADDRVTIALAEWTLGDLQAAAGDAAAARAAWTAGRDAAAPGAAKGRPSAMLLAGLTELRLGHPQVARAWADSLSATSYRHPVFADLEKQLGLVQSTGETPRPLQGKPWPLSPTPSSPSASP